MLYYNLKNKRQNEKRKKKLNSTWNKNHIIAPDTPNLIEKEVGNALSLIDVREDFQNRIFQHSH